MHNQSRAPSALPLVCALALTGCVSFAGCVSDEPDPPGDAPLTHPCAATWGFDTVPAGAAFVDPSRSEPGDGSLAAPFSTLDAALLAVRADGRRLLLLATGELRAERSVRRFAFSDTWGDDGLILAGCGADTVLAAIEAPPPGSGDTGPDTLQPTLEIYGPVQGLQIRDLTLRGGRRGVIVRDGAGSVTAIRFERVRVEESVRTGILVQGLDTSVTLVDCAVDGVVADDDVDGALGYGVSVQAGGSPWDEVLGRFRMDGGSVRGATRLGVLIDRADAELVGVTVADTLPGTSDGARDGGPALGRGIQVQQVATAVLDGVTSTGNIDAAVFLQLPLDVTIRNSVLTQTQRMQIPGAVDAPPSGDGLAATQPGLETVDTWQLTLEDNTFSDNGRAGALVEDIAVTLLGTNVFSGNQITADGETYPLSPTLDALYAQGAAEVTGDSVPIGPGTAFEAQEMFRDVLDLDNLAE